MANWGWGALLVKRGLESKKLEASLSTTSIRMCLVSAELPNRPTAVETESRELTYARKQPPSEAKVLLIVRDFTNHENDLDVKAAHTLRKDTIIR